MRFAVAVGISPTTVTRWCTASSGPPVTTSDTATVAPLRDTSALAPDSGMSSMKTENAARPSEYINVSTDFSELGVRRKSHDAIVKPSGTHSACQLTFLRSAGAADSSDMWLVNVPAPDSGARSCSLIGPPTFNVANWNISSLVPFMSTSSERSSNPVSRSTQTETVSLRVARHHR